MRFPVITLLFAAPIGDDFSLDRIRAYDPRIAGYDLAIFVLTDDLEGDFRTFNGQVRNRGLAAGPNAGGTRELAGFLPQFEPGRDLGPVRHGEGPFPNAFELEA